MDKALAAESKRLLKRIKKVSKPTYHKRERQWGRFNRGLRRDVKRLGA